MVRVDAEELFFQGTWIDGYIPKRQEIERLARLYRGLDIDEQGIPRNYGFSQATDVWLAEDFFGGIASAIRDKFHHENLPPNIQPAPCLMWLIQTNKEPYEHKMLPLYEEYQADPRKENYYHLVTVRQECPAGEGCLQQVIKDLHFESKTESTYVDLKRFTDAVHELLDYYVDIVAAPWQQIKKHLRTISENINPIGP